jgi:hypothetical protein
LTKALDRVDVFFGDPRRKDKSWVARALGLETRGERWTARAFDRCLLLALIYPMAAIVAVWTWSARVGVAEQVLGLWETPADSLHGGLVRWAFSLSIVAVFYASGKWAERGLATPLWVGAFVAVAVALAGGGVAAFSAFTVAFGVVVGGAAGVAFAVAFAVAATVTDAAAGFVASAVAAAAALAVVSAVASISDWSIKTDRQGAFLSLYLLATTLAAFACVWLLSSSRNWPIGGAILLIFCVLTLVNAPLTGSPSA